jgi:hypothetical protein
MAEVNRSKLVSFLKKNEEASQKAAADHLGVTIGQLPMLTFCAAKVEAGIVKTAPGTPQSVKKLRDSEGERWEMIAARTKMSVAGVKRAYEEAGGNASSSFTGRGRNFSNGGSSNKTRSSGSNKKTSSRSSGKKTSAAKSGSKTRGSGKKTGVRRARTRAERQASSANPS